MGCIDVVRLPESSPAIFTFLRWFWRRGCWRPDREIKLPAIPLAPKVDKTRIYLVNVPRAAQTEFRVGYATGLKWDATGEFYRAKLMNFPFGGDFNSRMNLDLREDKGWTYGALIKLILLRWSPLTWLSC